MKKYIKDFEVIDNLHLNKQYSLLKLQPVDGMMPMMRPGQFVQVYIENSRSTYLRRPISINFVDTENNLLWLLVRDAGKGTHELVQTGCGSILNLVLPLGNGFKLHKCRPLLVGGGVGVAPLLFLGKELKEMGCEVSFLLGARSAGDLLEVEEFSKYGSLFLSTEDGSKGEKGLVTNNSIFHSHFDMIYCCGPLPMMKAVAGIARAQNMECEVSLENTMACGIGACLCCVEDTVSAGNVCVCKEGPVFNIKELKW